MLRVMYSTCQESVDLIRDFVDNEFLESSSVELKLERFDLVQHIQTGLENRG